jgi:alkanesulfonate monooxygenase SsuD/methylene tetrahydromethanopterin reductase-like flavin-dependent oxidoreductase (luciferase family)
MTLCLGAGSLPEEFPRHGLAVGQTLGDRLQALDEALQIVTGILAGDEVTFDSANYQFDRVRHRPRPLQSRVPVIVGATGEKVGLRIAAKHADYWQMSIEPDSVADYQRKVDVLAGHSASLSRDPSSIRRLPEIATVLRETRQEADRAFAAHASHFAWSEDTHAAMARALFAGDVDEVVAALEPFQAVGIDGLIYQALPPYDFETVRRIATELRPALEATRVERSG